MRPSVLVLSTVVLVLSTGCATVSEVPLCSAQARIGYDENGKTVYVLSTNDLIALRQTMLDAVAGKCRVE